MKEKWLFPDSIAEARVIQEQLASSVVTEDNFSPIQLIGGLDVSHNLYDPTQLIYSACVTLSYPDKVVCEKRAALMRQEFPYIPGFLGFREAPALVTALRKLRAQPDLLFVDGHGISHPRGLGIASQIGVGLNIPTIGVAKTILVGQPEGELGDEVGSQVPLVWKGKCVGMMVRSKKRCQPLIISIGHRISLKSAVEFVQEMLIGYRLPEPTRLAHLTANEARKNGVENIF